MKEKVVIDANNLYVQGLMKVINQFMVEEASMCLNSEIRLKNSVEKLKDVFSEERKQMVISGNMPMFSTVDAEDFNLEFGLKSN